jgi:SpoIID/LytB domain protein
MLWKRVAGRAAGTVLAALTAMAVLPMPSAAAAVPVLVLDGTGYGHGVGLSQWGAEYMARTGHPVEQILATFYPGAQLAEASGPIRVAVHRPATSTTTLTFPAGGEVRSPLEGQQAPGFPVAVGPGGRVRVTFDGGYRVDPLVTAQSTTAATPYAASRDCAIALLCPTTTQPPDPSSTTTTTPKPGADDDPGTAPGGPGPGAPDPGQPAPPPPGGTPAAGGPARSGEPVWAVPATGGITTVDDRGRSYRGVVEATGGGGLRLVNVVDVEDYLRGMAEVPGTWPAAAVQAQTVAARTYALRSMQASGEICDDARCQVYVGATAETAGQSAAVAATARRVLAYSGALAAAVYSADAGGVSATTQEGFGTPDGVYPYLTTVRYETDNPLPWHLEIAVADLGARFAYPGTVTGAHVGAAGPSGRALEVVLEGSAGPVTVEGRRFARALGLRSTRFVATSGSAAAQPAPPPPAEEALQVLPEETAAPARRSLRPEGSLGLDRRAPAPATTTPKGVVPALDPRRHLVILVAAVAAAGVLGANLPLWWAGPSSAGGSVAAQLDARRFRAWRRSTRSP